MGEILLLAGWIMRGAHLKLRPRRGGQKAGQQVEERLVPRSMPLWTVHMDGRKLLVEKEELGTMLLRV